MEDKDILLPAMPKDWNSENGELWAAIWRWKRENYKENHAAVFEELITELMRDYAREAVRMNQKQAPASEPMPFSLEAAKRGDPLVTRDGRKARFVAYEPELKNARVLYMMEGQLLGAGEDGKSTDLTKLDLFLAPKPKRTVWVNVNKRPNNTYEAYAYGAKEDAELLKANYPRMATAVPIQIDDVGGEG